MPETKIRIQVCNTLHTYYIITNGFDVLAKLLGQYISTICKKYIFLLRILPYVSYIVSTDVVQHVFVDIIAMYLSVVRFVFALVVLHTNLI